MRLVHLLNRTGAPVTEVCQTDLFVYFRFGRIHEEGPTGLWMYLLRSVHQVLIRAFIECIGRLYELIGLKLFLSEIVIFELLAHERVCCAIKLRHRLLVTCFLQLVQVAALRSSLAKLDVSL